MTYPFVCRSLRLFDGTVVRVRSSTTCQIVTLLLGYLLASVADSLDAKSLSLPENIFLVRLMSKLTTTELGGNVSALTWTVALLVGSPESVATIENRFFTLGRRSPGIALVRFPRMAKIESF